MSSFLSATRTTFTARDRQFPTAKTVYLDVGARIDSLADRIGAQSTAPNDLPANLSRDLSQMRAQHWPKFGQWRDRDLFEGWDNLVQGGARRAYKQFSVLYSRIGGYINDGLDGQ